MATTFYHDTIAADSPIFAGLGTVGTDGTVIGSPISIAGPTQDTGDFGLQFNGTNEYVDTGYLGAPDGNGPFSIEIWVMPASSGNGGSLIGADIPGGGVPDVLLTNSASSGNTSSIEVSLGGGGTSYAIFSMHGTPSDCRVSAWNHTVLTFDGTNCYMYLNGVLVASESASNPFDPAQLSSLLIAAAGTPGPGVEDYCDSAISNVALYTKPLSMKRIIAHFAAAGGVPAYPNVSTYTGDYYPTIIGDNPIVYYRCDETAGRLAVDRSGNGHNGAYGLGSMTLDEPGAIYDGNPGVLFAETPLTPYDPTPAALITPVLSSSFTTQFSVEAWVDASSLPTEAEICSTCGDNSTLDGYGFRMFIDTSGVLNGEITWESSGEQPIAAPSALPSGQYNQCVMTYDLNNLILYVNGSQVASVSVSQALGPFRNNLVWGFMAQSNIGETRQFGGTIDEPAMYNYPLTPGQVRKHWVAGLGPLPPPVTGAIAGNDQHYWMVKIYDDRGQLVDIPKDDIDSLSLSDQLNGGSATSTMSFVRDFNKIGAINYLWSVQVWIWNGRIEQPLDPWWSGYMVDIDQEKTRTLGKITVHLEGDQKQLDRGVVYEDVNPLVSGNPPLDAADYIRHLYTTYAPPGFCDLSCPATLFPLLPGQYEMMQLGQVVDTVLKTGRDDLGNLVIWRVNRDANLQRTLLVEADQNPNTVAGVKFKMLFMDQLAKYAIHTKYAEICNVLTVQGGQDYITGLPVVGSFIDEDSLAAYGPWEQIISVWQLISQAAANSYAEAFLDIHGNPQATGDIELHNPDPEMKSGAWIQVWDNASVIRQMRITSARVDIGRSRIKMTLTPTAPTPYLDYAIYKMGLNSANTGVNQISKIPVNTQGNYVRSGGVLGSI